MFILNPVFWTKSYETFSCLLDYYLLKVKSKCAQTNYFLSSYYQKYEHVPKPPTTYFTEMGANDTLFKKKILVCIRIILYSKWC